MQRVIYTGPHRAVDLEDGTVAVQGKHTEVDDDLAKRLLARDDFRRAPTPKSSPEPEPEQDPEPENDDTGDTAGNQQEE